MVNWNRIIKAQELMKANNIDAYLVLTHDDFIYFMGEDRYQPRVIIPAEGKPMIVAFRGEEDEIKEIFGINDVRVFSGVGGKIKDVIGIMREILTKSGKEKIRVGVQMWFNTPAFLLNMFQKANSKVEVVDIALVMEPLRSIKSGEEIELIKGSARIASIGMEAAIKVLKPGITENEVAAEAEYAMRKAGALGTAVPIYVNSGIRSGWVHGTASYKVIQGGELVVINLLPVYKGYCSNLCRSFTVGKASEKQKQLFNAYKKAQEFTINCVRPGIKMKEVDEYARQSFTEDGFEEFFIAGISHGIGLSFEEAPAPTIKPNDNYLELKEGMALTVGHTILSIPGTGGVRMEDTFYLSEEGLLPLTDFPKELELNY